MASIKVAVRARPLSKREQELNSDVIIRMHDNKTSITNLKLPSGGSDTLGRERVKQFTYDYSYWSVNPNDHQYTSQQMVFHDLGYEVVDAAYQGYNGCIFAYGQTGSGKTFTMMGEPQNYGLIPRISQHLFSLMSDAGTTYRTEVSYLEIYNERVRDLLREKRQSQLNLKVREHPKDGPYVQDLSKHLVVNYNDIEGLILKGNSNRTTAATNMNDHSSRSHAIFTIVFTQARFVDDLPSEVHSKIHLVDLAGSERADAAGTSGERLKEGGSINKSLVTLGNVISQLADMSDKSSLAALKKATFIPYRDSVLTWLLKDSLGGNAKTIMIANISPAEVCYAETLSTLRYASRAKKIVNKPVVNEDPNVRLIRELREENARLRGLLGCSVDLMPTTQRYVNTREKLNRNEEKVKQLTDKWTVKWNETANVLEEHQTLALRKEGTGIVLDSDLPYLVSIEDHILSTGMKLYHLREGDTHVGREDAGPFQDIVLIGPYIEAEHCIIRNQPGGEVTIFPLEGAMCCVNNVRVHEPTRLTQGSIIRLGRGHLFRFNHPGEAAKLREELKGSGGNELIKVWRDFQWTWSTFSVADSAIGSELELEAEKPATEAFDKLEEKRKELEHLEEQHCLAEAQRLAQLAEQEGEREALREKEEHLHHLTKEAQSMKQKAEKVLEAQEEIKKLSVTIEQHVITHISEQERLQKEQDQLQRQKEKFERDIARARLERAKVRQKRREEEERLQLEKERQEEEWVELSQQRRHLETILEEKEDHIEKERAQLTRKAEAEQTLYHEEMEEMRNFVEGEVKQIKELAKKGGVGESADGGSESRLLGEDGISDLESLTLTIKPEGDGSLLEDLTDKCSESRHDPHTSSAVPLMLPPGDINAKLHYLASQVTDIHVKVCGALQRKYSSILSSDDKTHGLGKEVLAQFTSMKPMFEQLERMAITHSTPKTLHDKLKDYDRILTIVDRFLQIHEILQVIDDGIKKKSFLTVIENLDAAMNLLSAVDAEEEIERSVQKVFQTELCILREKLLYELSEMWNRLLKWTLPPESRKQSGKHRTVILEITGVAQDLDCLECVVQAMYSVNMLESRIKMFCDKLLSHIVEGVVTDRNTLLQVIDETDKHILCVVLNPAGSYNSLLVPPAEAYQKLEQVFLFLHQPLQDITVHEIEEEGKDRVPVTLVEKMGDSLIKKLFESIYNGCLAHALPRGGTHSWDEFNQTVFLTEKFQELLQKLKFMTIQKANLMDYLNNVNSLFANIKSQEILKKAHEFMTQELMNSLVISAEHPLGNVRGDENRERTAFVKKSREEAGTSNLKMPTCQISHPIRSLMCLTYDTLKEGLSSSQEGALHLCHSVQNMFELYCDVVPAYHKEKLSSLPLLAALHHNNCMFLAHHLITVEKMFNTKLEGVSPSREAQLGDMVTQVRQLGNDSFTEHINLKKQQICDHLNTASDFTCVADDEGRGGSEAVQRMMHHLKHISSIWNDVLPTHVYFKAVGSLLNTAVSDIISSVLSIEEFSMDDCQYLQEILSNILHTAVDCFKVSDSKINPVVALHENVQDWMKFKELVQLLHSGLQDVSDRWSDGKGPLALYFTAGEIRRLVIGIFENTSKRDMLLTQLR